MCSILPVRPITQRVLVIYCSLFCSVPCEALFARPSRHARCPPYPGYLVPRVPNTHYLRGPDWGRGGERGRYQTSRLKITFMFIQWGYIIMRDRNKGGLFATQIVESVLAHSSLPFFTEETRTLKCCSHILYYTLITTR